MERDRDAAMVCCENYNFNSHAHVERDHTRYNVTIKGEYFNSHAHVERDSAHVLAHFANVISTHTLTWSVTGGGSNQGTAENDFNSHAHVERDAYFIALAL